MDLNNLLNEAFWPIGDISPYSEKKPDDKNKDKGEPGEKGEPGDGEPGQPGEGDPSGDGQDGEGQDGGEPSDKDINDAHRNAKANDRFKKPGDETKPGQDGAEGEEGKDGKPSDKDGKASGKTPTMDDIDEHMRRIQDKLARSKDHAPNERPMIEPKEGGKKAGAGGKGGRGGVDNTAYTVDYSKIKPTFNWVELVKRFVASAPNKTEETWKKPSRRSASNLDIMRQTGSAAIKPGIIQAEHADAKLLFCLDVSGSMDSIIPRVFANAVKLLQQPKFRDNEIIVLKYSGSYRIFRVNFTRGKGAEVPDVKTKPRGYPMSAQAIMGSTVSGATNFTAAIANQLMEAMAMKWNVLIFIDSDNLVGENFMNLASVIKADPRRAFIVFDSRDTYIQFRKQFGSATQNITYFD